MDLTALWGLAQLFGPVAPFAVYVIWDKQRTDAKWLKHEENRLVQDNARVEADKALAVMLNGLTIAITAMGGRR